MAQTNATIKNSWSLLAFAKKFDSMKVGNFHNSETGDPFKSCIFTKGDDLTFVAFSSKLGELSPKQIAEQKDALQVVEWQTEDNHGFTLAKKGNESWEEVDLGL